jgi:hypothetical protein
LKEGGKMPAPKVPERSLPSRLNEDAEDAADTSTPQRFDDRTISQPGSGNDFVTSGGS